MILDYKWVAGLFLPLWIISWQAMARLDGFLYPFLAVALISFAIAKVYVIKFNPAMGDAALLGIIWMSVFVFFDMFVVAINGSVFGERAVLTNKHLLSVGAIFLGTILAEKLRLPRGIKFF